MDGQQYIYYSVMSDIFFDDDNFVDSEGQAGGQEEDEVKEEEQRDYEQQFLTNTFNKTYHKNKFINKIKDLDPDAFSNTLKKETTGIVPQIVDKKERNKFSAKQSRDRKKLYIEILEERKDKLEKQLNSRKKELEETKSYLQRVVSQNQTMSGFTAGRHEMIKKLQFLLDKAKKTNIDPSQEINTILDGLRYRIGATGKERIKTINEYFKQIVNLSLPALHRYMMWSAAEEKHLFSKTQNDSETDQWFKELRKSLSLSEEQKKEILSKQEFLKEQKLLLEDLIGDLKNVKDEIEEKSIQLEDIIDGVRQILTPIQSAHFILFIEKNKYRKQLNLCDSNLKDQEPPLRKLIKKE